MRRSTVALLIAVAALSGVLWLGGLALAVQDQFFGRQAADERTTAADG